MKKSIMQQTIRLFVLLALFCISAEQAWASDVAYSISTGTVEGGTLQFYSTAECDGDEITSIGSGKTVYIKATPESGYLLVGFTAANITVVRAGDTGAAESRRNAATDGPEVGGKVAVSAENATNGIYKFTMPAKDVVVSATFPPNMPITITADNGSKTYDGTPLTKTTFTVSGQAQGDTHKFTVTMTAASTITNAGSTDNVIATVDGVTVTPGEQTRVGNYLVTTQSGTLTVNPKTVTVASGITVSNKFYDGTKTADVSCSGAKFSGKVSGDVLSISGVTGTFSDKKVGTNKTVTLNYSGAKLIGESATNYQLATSGNQASTKASITKKAVTVTGRITVKDGSKVYDGTTTATTDCSGATLSGKVSGDVLTISGVTGTFDTKNVGTDKTVTLNYSSAKFGGKDAGNYKLDTSGNQATAKADITKKTVSVKSGITVSQKVYNGTTTADVSCSGATLNGKVSGDVLTIKGVTGTFDSKNVGTGKTVTLDYSGAYLDGASAANYELATSGNQATATGIITKRTVTVTSGIAVNERPYDGATTATTDCSGATFNGKVSSDVLTISGVTGTFSDKNVGTGKTVTLNYSSATLGGQSADNYQLATSGNQATAKADITKKTVSVKSGITVSDKVYNGTTTADVSCGGATLSGKVSGDVLTISGVTGTFDSKDVGTGKTVTLNYSNAKLGGTSATNYELAATGNQASTKASITKLTVTVISGIAVNDRPYDGTASATTDCSGATVEGTLEGEELTVSGVTGTFNNKDIGTGKTVTLDYTDATLDGLNADNYELAATGNQTTATANITKRTITVVEGITIRDKVYYGTTTATVFCSSATLDGLIAGEQLSIINVTGTFDSKDVGTGKTVTLDYSGASLYGTDAANYQLATSGNQATATGNITKATLTVTANAKTISYGDDADNNGVTYSGFVSGEGESDLNNAPVYKYNTEAEGSGDDYMVGSPVGVYYIIPSGLSSNNYAITYKTGVLTVEAKNIDYAGGTVNEDENGYNVSLTEGTGSANPLPLDEDDELANLTYSRTLKAPGESEGDKTIDGKAAKLYTVCLPFEPLTGEAVRYYTLSSVKGTVLDFEEVVIPVANTPYLVAVFGNANFTENCTDVDVTSTAINSTIADGYTLKGTFTGLSNAKAAGKYILQDSSKWGQVPAENTAVYIPPFRAYIEGPSNDAREMSSSFGENATSINALRLVGSDGTERWYDLQGRRIEQPTKKGIYINNGKKIKR